jgi:hypothetical protein
MIPVADRVWRLPVLLGPDLANVCVYGAKRPGRRPVLATKTCGVKESPGELVIDALDPHPLRKYDGTSVPGRRPTIVVVGAHDEIVGRANQPPRVVPDLSLHELAKVER